MALLYDSNGNVIGDDGLNEWDANTYDPNATINRSVTNNDVGYIGTKIAEFQNALTVTADTAQMLEDLKTLDVSPDSLIALQDQLDIFYSRRGAFKFAAESFNAVSNLVVKAGGSTPQLNIPAGLGFAPIVIPLATAAAIAGGASLVVFAAGWIASSNRVAIDAANSIADPTMRDQALAKASGAANANNLGGIGTFADIAKYAAIAAVLYFGYKIYLDNK